jgi:hypothetical protein
MCSLATLSSGGTRLSVEFVIGLMADGWSEADILGNTRVLRTETSSRARGDAVAHDFRIPRPNLAKVFGSFAALRHDAEAGELHLRLGIDGPRG